VSAFVGANSVRPSAVAPSTPQPPAPPPEAAPKKNNKTSAIIAACVTAVVVITAILILTLNSDGTPDGTPDGPGAALTGGGTSPSGDPTLSVELTAITEMYEMMLRCRICMREFITAAATNDMNLLEDAKGRADGYRARIETRAGEYSGTIPERGERGRQTRELFDEAMALYNASFKVCLDEVYQSAKSGENLSLLYSLMGGHTNDINVIIENFNTCLLLTIDPLPESQQAALMSITLVNEMLLRERGCVEEFIIAAGTGDMDLLEDARLRAGYYGEYLATNVNAYLDETTATTGQARPLLGETMDLYNGSFKVCIEQVYQGAKNGEGATTLVSLLQTYIDDFDKIADGFDRHYGKGFICRAQDTQFMA
jgi:hypothetical protein